MLAVVAEGDGRCRCLEYELAQGGHSGGLGGDVELVDERQQGSRVERLAWSVAGEQSATAEIGDAVPVVPVRDQLEQDVGECFGDWPGWLAEADEDLVTIAGERPPTDADGTVQRYVSCLRRALAPLGGDFLVLTRSPGYLLAVNPMTVDAVRFEQIAAEVAAAAYRRAGARLRQALALWRWDAYGEFAQSGVLRAEGRRLEELRLMALEDRITADLELGRPTGWSQSWSPC